MFLAPARIRISSVFAVRYLEKWVKLVFLRTTYLLMDENVCELFVPEKYLGTTSSLFYEQLPMELQHVKEIIIRSDKNMKRSASEDSSSINNYDLDLTGLVESIGE